MNLGKAISLCRTQRGLTQSELADRAGLEMPITNEVNAVLYDGKPARHAVAELMNRPLREEIL